MAERQTKPKIASTKSGTSIPREVKHIAEMLREANHSAYLVGGCVRDLLLKRKPKDWDIATEAKPEEIQRLFPDSVYENTFGTVGIKTESGDESVNIVEVTTFRTESEYSDRRHPDAVQFANTIEDDLARRDFTINAMAIAAPFSRITTRSVVDPFGGRDDIAARRVKAVGDPRKRFEEDAVRLMRAIRFAAELDFSIEERTFVALQAEQETLGMIAKERVRDELVKILMTPRAAEGVIGLKDAGLLRYVVPELAEGIGCGQNKHHIYSVFDHNVRALRYAAEKGYSLEVRLASLLHDVGKPKTKRGEGADSTFYGHEVVGAKMAMRALDRLRFPKDSIDRVVHLVRYHLFYYNVGEVTEAGVRRFLSRVGAENIDDLIKVREADRIGSGVPKAVPYKLRHLLFMIEKVKRDPVHPKMLAVRGDDVMQILGIGPGPKIGAILSVLLEAVLDDPSRNTKEYLEPRVRELAALSEEELFDMGKQARSTKEEFESGIEKDMKRQFFVQ